MEKNEREENCLIDDEKQAVLGSLEQVDMQKQSKNVTDLKKQDDKKTDLVRTKNAKKSKGYFTPYEIIWFFSLMALSVLFMFLFPESDVNGVSGVFITILYVADVVFAIGCELLIAKQSRWGSFVYIFVDIIELVILILLNTRFMSMATTIFFWFPIHLMTFLNWNKHTDEKNTDLTQVRQLNWWKSLLMLLSCVIGTLVFGYLVAVYAPETDFYASSTIQKIVAYFDACVGIVSIFDGVLMLLRYKETWLVWYISIAMETATNILSGQWILIVLKIGYLTNSIYGYAKWSKYINKKDKNLLSDANVHEKTVKE